MINLNDITETTKERIRAAELLHIRWVATQRQFEPLVERMNKLPILEGQSLICSYDGDLNIHATGDGKLFAGIFRALRTNKYKNTSKFPNEKTAQWASWFCIGEDQGQRVWFSFTSSVCKMIQIGTEMKEVPKYAVECETFASPELEYEPARLPSPTPHALESDITY